jgi:hypothetical protein
MKNFVFALLAFVLVVGACETSPLKTVVSSPAPVRPDVDVQDVDLPKTTSTILAKDVSGGFCGQIKFSTGAEGQVPRSLWIEAVGPKEWGASVSVWIRDATGDVCSGTFSENGNADCGRFLIKDGDRLDIDVGVAPNGKTGVTLWLHQSAE